MKMFHDKFMEKKKPHSKEVQKALLYFRPGSHSLACDCVTCERLSEGYFSMFDEQGNYKGHPYEKIKSSR